ncbi:MAG: DUF3575 domain-containing protein [Bacteroides sp.]|nr:DUF3575 domain-containing protein [Bacteroides sp.]MCM1389351.1 DUF3575 domain-containing protein [Bacteroides sp.]
MIKRYANLTLLIIALLVLCIPSRSNAQNFAAKTNLLYDLTSTINIGAEAALAPKWSLDISGNMNFWSFSHGKRWKQWMIQPEARYWLCRNMGGHFFAAHALGGQYNVGHVNLDFLSFLGDNFKEFKDFRHQGWFAGAGIGYGYSWILGKHWNLEAEIAVGYVYTRYDVYECAGCGKKVDTDREKHYIGPTKAAINLVYVF